MENRLMREVNVGQCQQGHLQNDETTIHKPFLQFLFGSFCVLHFTASSFNCKLAYLNDLTT